MKKIKWAAILLLVITGMLACTNMDKKKETKDTVALSAIDSTKKPIADSSNKSEQKITVKFVDFSLGDAAHYIFKDRSEKIWDFADCTDKQFSFGIELPSKKANTENQGWASNKALQGKWFELTYEYVTQPEYQDGPMAKVPIITKVIMKN